MTFKLWRGLCGGYLHALVQAVYLKGTIMCWEGWTRLFQSMFYIPGYLPKPEAIIEGIVKLLMSTEEAKHSDKH
jgi:Ni,Fe-hydrogenase III small subunit